MSTSALSCGPDTTTIDAPHLSITQKWTGGGSRNIHLMQNDDLNVLIGRLKGEPTACPIFTGDNGMVVVSLGVDEDHDEVQFSFNLELSREEVIAQAIEALEACAGALRRFERA